MNFYTACSRGLDVEKEDTHDHSNHQDMGSLRGNYGSGSSEDRNDDVGCGSRIRKQLKTR